MICNPVFINFIIFQARVRRNSSHIIKFAVYLQCEKERIEKAFDLYELNSLNDGTSGDYSNDLAELEVHKTRIYILISNMITRSSYLKDLINETHDQHPRRTI